MLKPGRWFAVYVAGYGLGRLWVESLRIDFATEVFGFRVNTWISLVLIVVGLLWLFWRGSPVDPAATAELRAGGDPLARVALPAALVAQEEAALDAAADELAEEQAAGDQAAGDRADDDTVAGTADADAAQEPSAE